MHEAALKADVDPDHLSFIHAVRVVRRKLAPSPPFPPQHKLAFYDTILEEILQERVSSSRKRRNPRAVKRKMSASHASDPPKHATTCDQHRSGGPSH